MATVNLGSIKFNWKGTYAGATAYKIDDVVEYNGSSYISIQAGTGNLPTDTAYWELMSQKGTNGTDGTDLTSTLTTQGDILYRDGSGLQRLGAGTSGQVLQTGGTGANPSWTAVSSDFVKLSDTSASGNPTSIAVSDIFTSDYKAYKILVNNYYTSATARLYLRFTTTSTNEVTSGYFQVGAKNYYRWSLGDADGNGNIREHNANYFQLTNENNGTSATNSIYSEITFMNPRQSSEYRWVMAKTGIRAPNNYHYTDNWTGYQNQTGTSYNGFLIQTNSGTISNADIKVYGIK
jgi:hypothetical protein